MENVYIENCISIVSDNSNLHITYIMIAIKLRAYIDCRIRRKSLAAILATIYYNCWWPEQ